MVRLLRRLVAGATIVALTACDPGSALYSRTDEPILTLVLSPPGSLTFDLPQSAVLALTGVPTHVEFVRAEAFETFRASDNNRFDWMEVEPSRPPGAGPLFRPLDGNYRLPDSTTPRGLGRSDLRGGETYRLMIRFAGRVIEGTTRMPEQPEPRVVETPEGLRVVWPKIDAAPFYLVYGATVNPARDFYKQLTADTVAIPILIDDLPSSVRVVALDSNYARFLSDTSTTRSGLNGALGVFGSINAATVVVR